MVMSGRHLTRGHYRSGDRLGCVSVYLGSGPDIEHPIQKCWVDGDELRRRLASKVESRDVTRVIGRR